LGLSGVMVSVSFRVSVSFSVDRGVWGDGSICGCDRHCDGSHLSGCDYLICIYQGVPQVGNMQHVHFFCRLNVFVPS